MKKIVTVCALIGFALPSHAAIMSVSGELSSAGTAAQIIAAPASVADDAPGAENTGMQGFNERQGFTLGAALDVDGANDIAAGTVIDSHMIFLNTAGSSLTTHGFGQDGAVNWTFSGDILGVVSDRNGVLLAASDFLGLDSTAYPGAFDARGLESNPLDGLFNDDFYSFSGNVLSLGMRVTEPGDWIRVVTASDVAPVPLPAAAWMLLSGLAAIGAASRRRRAAEA
jgi:hypothetical protein